MSSNFRLPSAICAAAGPGNPVGFHWAIPPNGLLFRNMPSGFVYASAAMPPPPQSKIPVFGAPRYRASIPFLAVAPRTTFADADTWS
jgi:hypothetical protein